MAVAVGSNASTAGWTAARTRSSGGQEPVAPSEPEPLHLVEEASVETTIEDPVLAEDFIGDIADDYVDDAAKTLAAQDRVSETLKAPFSFPWNKRNVAATPKDADKRDTNIPAK